MKPSSLMSQAAISTGGVLAQGLARFAYTVLIGRVMGPEDLAHVSAWIALALILSLLWPTGAGNAAAHFLAHERALGHSPVPALRLIQRSFWISCAGMLLIGLPVAMIALGADIGDTIAIGVLIVTWSGYVLARGIEVGLGRITSAAIWDVISSATTIGLLTIVLVTRLPGALLWPIAIGYAVFALHSLRGAHLGHDELRQESGLEPARILKFISWNSLGLLASNGLIQFAMVFVFIVEPPLTAGLFAAAMSLATPASMLSQAITQVLIPRFTEWVAADRVASRRRYLMVFGVMFLGLGAVFGAVALASPIVVDVVFHATYREAAPIMAFLLIGVFAFSISLVATAYLLTTGRTRVATAASVVGLVVGLIVMVAGTPVLTGSWAAVAGVISGYTVTAVWVIAASFGRVQADAPRGIRVPLV
ncbi:MULTISPECIES: lipopolysaccharide biosynthesis protein [Cryobacterium]|uniref:Lipopolysaccharide biosynthesis protein n=2 Tax=Cryobacterium TaxID=69578 RepID=A0ABY2IKP5_9MICO|nr:MULTISPECIES: lipopolysaccharide biosynthesis protein [Cryobacterium]MEB0001328.1 lipopolysaccharide biosynthesis protein [Cryobacterium sp. RTC2.1]MEB0303958.1 lipopolysaccharide biosynthesis protein [Cryobacterium sp. 10I1]TFB97987.1 lipopolysaccharide biosynthesis protein [Cryobacterium sp. MDB2-A-1]TFC09820.1 lipopolysaccharide biosynthesis protein [Cryobacterium sp. MDB2-33-2]TFC10921.1 lipopolysaccharide biosynthesis protein [Cryobacterium sp. MDB2-A-2]